MKIHFDPEGSAAGLERLTKKALKEGAEGLAVLAAEGNGFTPGQLDPLLKSLSVPVSGGVFPAVIHGGRAHDRGSVLLGLRGKTTTASIHGLSSPDTDIEGPLEKLADSSASARTMLVFVDAFSSRISPFVQGLFYIFGLEINYIGGGAGSLAGGGRPCLLSNSGMFSDGAAMALTSLPSGVGVAHGWSPVGDPMQATSTAGNVLRELDFKPAFEVYGGVVSRLAGRALGKADFAAVSRSYPFGIARLNREMIVRDPLKADPDGSLVCAGEIPQDAYIHIMTGDQKSLMAAAREAAGTALASLPGGDPGNLLLIDCISRRLFLGPDFGKELKLMAHGKVPAAGACTIGEIANSGAEFLEFYNKTAVVAAIGKL